MCLYIEVFGLFVVPYIYKAGWEKHLMLAGKDTTPMGEREFHFIELVKESLKV